MTDILIPEDLDRAGTSAGVIPVHVSYEIIRLFSEGLYQSPHKAIEELVSNSYDAQASEVHILMPETRDIAIERLDEEDSEEFEIEIPTAPLWVIDNGSGMDREGFFQLWRVADSAKATVTAAPGERLPIGQFGIGKLAAYVLAWRLVHMSKSNREIHMTSMDFRKLEGLHQDEASGPFQLNLRKIEENEAMRLLAEIEIRDPRAWELLFGDGASETWTVAALTDFKALYDRLRGGRLAWVLRTGLPLYSDFSIWLNNEELQSSKLSKPSVFELTVGSDDDVTAKRMALTLNGAGIEIPGIEGEVTGTAVLFEERLTTGKSEQYGRSNGFFIRVRGRVINLEDELFGLEALNHAAWSRFSMEVNADGLRDHLLSSREGVRESIAIANLREYLHGVFNQARQAYDDWNVRQIDEIDLGSLLRDAPSIYVTEPLVSAVTETLESGQESFYIDFPKLEEDVSREEWLEAFARLASESPFSQVIYEGTGRYDRALRYMPMTRSLKVNTDHPFIDKMLAGGKSRGHVALFGSAEVFIDALLHGRGIPASSIVGVLEDRDRILRLLSGDQPSTASEVMQLLESATRNSLALERVVGATFKVLGFEYERLGGADEGPDGILYARLGRKGDALADYKVVYDSKQTDEPSVPASKVKIDSLEDFRRAVNAQFGFFFAKHYAKESDLGGKLNRELIAATSRREDPAVVSLLRIEDLKRIVMLHYQYGITLTRLRSLFETAHTVPEVQRWIDTLENELIRLEPRVPLQRLLDKLEEAKFDELATPNVYAIRVRDEVLVKFEPEKLIAALEAVSVIVGSRWIEVERTGEVRIHHTATQITAEVERALRDLLGVDASEPSNPIEAQQ